MKYQNNSKLIPTDSDRIKNMISQYNGICLDDSEITKYLSIDN